MLDTKQLSIVQTHYTIYSSVLQVHIDKNFQKPQKKGAWAANRRLVFARRPCYNINCYDDR